MNTNGKGIVAMNYVPLIKAANPKQRFQIGRYTAVLLGDIEPEGMVEYKFIMVLFDGDTQKACYFVASEVNSLAGTGGGGSHFLGIFDGNGHANCGASDNWADETKFTAEALRIIKAKFEVQN